jgi:peptide/nickel transport system substrate-binding protein
VRPGGDVVFAATQGAPPNFILPLVSASYASQTNINDFQFLCWRPLYWMGGPGTVGVNYSESIGKPPVVTQAGANTQITVNMKSLNWSNGKPVTSRDVEFWLNLLKAEKSNWWDYTPGDFPDNILSATYPSPHSFTLLMKGHYNPAWVLNELAQIIPIPQSAWDKTSASGPVGTYDTTSSGAAKVYNFLAAANKDLAGYATNPIWQVVDGPWHLSAYNATTFDAVFKPNPHWSLSPKPTIAQFEVKTFTSDTAEFNALRSGSVTYGYIPPADDPQIPSLESAGFTIKPWVQWNINFASYNFSNPTVGPIFKQLYVRQALQHLIDQPLLIHATMGGHGYVTNGPVPLVPASKWVSPQEKVGWYPYSVSTAKSLLTSHGWHVAPNATTTCVRAGTAAGDCGAGIPSGAALKFTFTYVSGNQSLTEQATALQTSFAQVGVQLQLSPVSLSALFSVYFPCSPGKACPWEIAYDGGGWGFEPTYNMPELGSLLATGGVSNAQAYSSATNDKNLQTIYYGSGAMSDFYNYENYLGKQLPLMWMPEILLQVSAVQSKLVGWYPQQPQLDITPETWKFVS